MNYQAILDIYVGRPVSIPSEIELRDDGNGIYIYKWDIDEKLEPTMLELESLYNANRDSIIYNECHAKLVENHLNFFVTSSETNYGWYKCDTQRMNEFADIVQGTISQGLTFNVIRDDKGVSRQLTITQLQDWLHELRVVKQVSFYKKRQIESALQQAVGEAKYSIPLNIVVTLADLNYFKSLPPATIEAMLLSTIGI